MREIKFRGWDKKNKEMVYNINLLFSNYLNECFEEYEECGLKIMQYTGFKDKNGKEIYAGDICRWRDLETFNDEIIEDVFMVVWNDEKLAWYTQNEDGNFGYDLYEYTDDYDLAVIGNIYENIDLLEVETSKEV